MKNTQLLAALFTLSLLPSSVEAQSFQARRAGGNFQAAGRVDPVIKVDFNLAARQHQFVESGNNTGVRVREVSGPQKEGSFFAPRIGLPDLGMRLTKVLLPYEAAAEDMKLEILSEDLVDIGVFDMAPAADAVADVLGENGEIRQYRELPQGLRLDQMGRDVMAYGAQGMLPQESLRLVSMGGRRGYRYARISFSPFRWNPQTRVLSKVASVQARIVCKRRLDITPALRERELGDPVMGRIEVSEDFLLPPGSLSSYFAPWRDTEGDYLIITTNLIRTTSAQLGPFITMKEAQGHDVFVKTVEEIEAEYPRSSRADSMRSFLRAEYQDLGIEYLLLLGDPDPDDQGDATDSVGEVPMFMTWPGGAFIADPSDSDSVFTHLCKTTPTDMYYTELTASCWDQDGDGFPGEFEDDFEHSYYSLYGFGFHVFSYPIDFDEELSAARIPFSDVQKVDENLAAQIEYQTNTLDLFESLVRRSVILAMAEFADGTRMDNLGRQIEDDLEAYGTGIFGETEIYETPTYDEHMDKDALKDEWGGTWGAGLVIWSGHGNQSATVVNDGTWSAIDYRNFIHRSNSASLTTTFTRSIVISLSCLNAFPSASTNLTHELMEDAAVGMFSHTGVMFYINPRSVAWGDESWGSDLGYLITQRLTNGEGMADSLSRTRRTRSASSRQRAKGMLVITAYGDPTCKYLYQ
ncbi:MAG: C25 family cysteine peptidase [Planctomycetes bacterium]|nr:C25 family cysteine peptidase [Planctomycetota bacterium]